MSKIILSVLCAAGSGFGLEYLSHSTASSTLIVLGGFAVTGFIAALGAGAAAPVLLLKK